MSGFNTSTRSSDVSMKLRAQNLHNARDQTKRLEDDNRKMEDRLRELKTAMTREKEERERQGGGFWGRGQSQAGSLTKYADEVLASKAERPPREGKKKKIKVLQDEPVEVPKRSSQPGTMKYIAQRKLPPGPGPVPQKKQMGPRCGQCEDRAATLSCVQCSEIYCPGCFAAFHVKGALKQHRSVPISASGPRVCMSPHPQDSPRGGQASGTVVSHTPSYKDASGAASARQTVVSPTESGVAAGSLLDGSYDETQSAASFQAALMAWRGESPVKDGDSAQSVRKPVASPVKSSVISVDESTGTTEEQRVPEIKFTSTLSYAERLLLKRHRRTELADVVTPRSNESPISSGAGDHSQQMLSQRSNRPGSSRSSGSFIRRNELAASFDREDTLAGGDEDRINFQSLLEAVTASETPDQAMPGESSSSTSVISITEVQSSFPTEAPKFRTSATYVVQEAHPMEAWKIQQNPQSTTFVKDKPSILTDPAQYASHLSVLKYKGETESDSDLIPKINTHFENSMPTINSVRDDDAITDLFPESHSISEFPQPFPSQTYNAEACFATVQRNKPKVQEKEQKWLDEGAEHGFDSKEKTSPKSRVSSTLNDHRSGFVSSQGDNGLEAFSLQGEGDGAIADHSKIVKAASRPKSGMSSRPKSSAAASRPSSRAQSRAASRMKVEGLLTKAPSSALSEVAHMVQSSQHTYTYQSPLEEFFLAGVEEQKQQPSVPGEDRAITPSKERKPKSASTTRPQSRTGSALGSKEEKYKISYKLYKMAPRSWRPDSSLGEVVPLGEVKLDDDPQDGGVMAYSYSGQLSGQPTEWCPTSSQSLGGHLPAGEDVGPSVGVFGDEMFTEEAAAAAAGTASVTSTPTPRAPSQHSLRLQHSGRASASGAANTSSRKQHSFTRDSNRQSQEAGAEVGDVTPTPRAARRKSANRRSVTPGQSDDLDNVGHSVGDSMNFGSERSDPVIVGSDSGVRRSANLRRGLSSSGSRAAQLLPSAMTPTPPSNRQSSHGEGMGVSSSSSVSHPAPSSEMTKPTSARSSQLSRRGLRVSSFNNTSGSGADNPEGRTTPVCQGSASKMAADYAMGRNSPSSRARPDMSKPVTSLSRQGTGNSSSGLSRHASNVETDRHRPASTYSQKGALSGCQQTPSQQWRPNSSTDQVARSASLSASLSVSGEGRLRERDYHRLQHAEQQQQYKDPVISDMLQSRMQSDGWMYGDDDDDDDDGDDDDDDDDDDDSEEDEEARLSRAHNYDDGNELNLTALMPKKIKSMSKTSNKGDNKTNALNNSQHWETEVRPFSGRSSIKSGRMDNSMSFDHNSRELSARGKLSSHHRPGISRPLSSMSQVSGRESRAVVMDGEDLSIYDNVGNVPAGEDEETEDKAALEKLEWELASDTGRLTADGQISRMSLVDDEVNSGASSRSSASARSLRQSTEEYDVGAKLVEDEQQAQAEVDDLDMRRSVTLDESEVKALR